MKKFIYISVGIAVLCITHLTIFIAGMAFQAKPTELESIQQSVDSELQSDVGTAMRNYKAMWNLCEQKFSLGMTGDTINAIRLNGQIDTLKVQTSILEEKWSNYRPQ